jgi:hypothetical protein
MTRAMIWEAIFHETRGLPERRFLITGTRSIKS